MMAQFAAFSLLTPALQSDQNMRALETLAGGLADLSINGTVLYDFDHVTQSALIHLAEQFNVLGDAGWDFAEFCAAPENSKRVLLKEALALHRFKGTRYAVQRVLDLMHVTARITEWWEQTPQGMPHTFLVDLLLTDASQEQPVLTPERAIAVLRMVRFWKPARSQFRARVDVRLRAVTRSGCVVRIAQRHSLILLPKRSQ